jgi:3-hydroxyacyl-[acyl-carrier-protein] dehydratase
MDPALIDQSKVAITKEQIYQVNPHRHEFQQLDGIFFIDDQANVMAGYRDVGADEFWVRGHIPGRPLLPGVLMIESAAQLVSYYILTHVQEEGFLGFGAVDQVKFRGQVRPGDRLILIGRMVEMRGRRRHVGLVQGFVKDQMVFEGLITGMFI